MFGGYGTHVSLRNISKMEKLNNYGRLTGELQSRFRVTHCQVRVRPKRRRAPSAGKLCGLAH
jgi:hypothetical protein